MYKTKKTHQGEKIRVWQVIQMYLRFLSTNCLEDFIVVKLGFGKTPQKVIFYFSKFVV
jgi:hypothetical protein